MTGTRGHGFGDRASTVPEFNKTVDAVERWWWLKSKFDK
jgi:hypothetical protein